MFFGFGWAGDALVVRRKVRKFSLEAGQIDGICLIRVFGAGIRGEIGVGKDFGQASVIGCELAVNCTRHLWLENSRGR